MRENLQCLNARYGRKAFAGGRDYYYGEEELLEGLAKHLHSRGVDEEAVQPQLRRLRVVDYILDPTPFAHLGQEVQALGDEPPRPDEDNADEDDAVPARATGTR